MTRLIVSTDQSQLVFIDMQSKLCIIMVETEVQTVAKNCSILVQAAKILEVPVMVTEQYPERLGNIMPEIAPYIGNAKPIAKTAVNVPKF